MKHGRWFLVCLLFLACSRYPEGLSEPKTLSYVSGDLPTWQSHFRPELFKVLEIDEAVLANFSPEWSWHAIDPNHATHAGLKNYLHEFIDESLAGKHCQKNPEAIFYQLPVVTSGVPYLLVFDCGHITMRDQIKLFDVGMEGLDGKPLRAYVLLPKDVAGRNFLYFHGHSSGRDEAAFDQKGYHKAIGFAVASQNQALTLVPQIRTFEPDNRSHYQFVKKHPKTDPPLFASMVIDGLLWGKFLRRSDFSELGLSKMPLVFSAGIAGTSLGSQIALWVGALDQNYNWVATFGGFYGFEVLFSKHHHSCQHVMDLLPQANIMDLALLVLPRHLLIGMGGRDKFYNSYSRSAIESLKTSLNHLSASLCTGTPSEIKDQLEEQNGQSCSIAVEVDPNAAHEITSDAKTFLLLGH